MSVLRDIGNKNTPQSEPIPGKDMAKNNAGGYSFSVDDWGRLNRFLTIGVDDGTYYVNARNLALDNVDVVSRCIKADPFRTVDAAVEVSKAGRAPNNDPALFVLAKVASEASDEGRAYALRHLEDVARIGTHLFHFAQFAENNRGWGRGLRRGVASWYEGKTPEKLAYQAIKYRQRDGWTHKDLLRLTHPGSPTDEHRAIYDFICGRENPNEPDLIKAFRTVQSAGVSEAVELISEYNLPWEALRSDQLATKQVWDALVENDRLPIGAMVRNLGVMTTRGTLGSREHLDAVVAKLSDEDQLHKSRLHPIAVLKALSTYRRGQSRGGVAWTPITKVLDTMDAAFYTTFENVEPADKRTLLALDVSGSMGFFGTNLGLAPREISAAMAMVTAATEPDTETVAFAHEMTPVDISPKRRLDDNIQAISNLRFGGTDCALPMLWAAKNNVDVDTFCVYTDSETWYGDVHPMQALDQYRQKTGIPARLVVVGITATGFTIADKDDLGTLDVAGFDTSTPAVLSDFSAGRF